jgi:hypothetical protein
MDFPALVTMIGSLEQIVLSKGKWINKCAVKAT